MLETLSTEALEAIFDALPVDLTFIDDTDTIIYYNRISEPIVERNPEIIGTKIQECHKPETIPKLNEILSELKTGRRTVVEDRRDRDGRMIHIRYLAVKDKRGRFIGTLEALQDITDLQKMTGEKRLLDEG